VRLRISVSAIRTIEHKGGLDAYLLDTPQAELTSELKRLKKRVQAAQAAQAAA